MGKMDEVIITIRREQLFEGDLCFQGILTDSIVSDDFAFRLDMFCNSMRRGDAEENLDYKQPIPYVIIKRADEVFLYKRLKGGGETRLYDNYSIGVGGHMNPVEGLNFGETLLENIDRELDEELIIDADTINVDVVGFINDDSNAVGKVHFGILMVANLKPESSVEVRETEQLEGEWVKIKDLFNPEYFYKLENWSKIALSVLSKEEVDG